MKKNLQNNSNILEKNNDIVKKEDLIPIVEQLQNTIEKLNILSDNLKKYKENDVDFTSIEVNNLSVDSLATVTMLTAQIVKIFSFLSVPEIQTNDITAMDLSASCGYFHILKVISAEIDNWNVSHFNIENINVSQNLTSSFIEAITSKISNLISDNITVSNNIIIKNNINTKNILSEFINTDKFVTKNFIWDGQIALSNDCKFFLEIPHFENGQYYIQLVYEQNHFATIEISNSVDNYSVKWSQSSIGDIQNIFKYGEDKESKIYIEIKNTTNKTLILKYGVISSKSVSYPITHKNLEFKPTISYKVVHKNGTKFFEHIDFQINDLQKIFNLNHPIGELYIQYLSQKNPMDLYNKNDIYSEWINITYEYYKNFKELPYRIWKRII